MRIEDYCIPKVVAIFDRPSTESFGMCPIIVPLQEHAWILMYRYAVLGYAGDKNYRASQEEWDYSLRTKSSLAVDVPMPENLNNPVALWLGYGFQKKAETVNAPRLPQVKGWHISSNEGLFTIVESEKAYSALEEWVQKAAPQALAENNSQLTSLMSWALPLHPYTQAAAYFTKSTPELKERELKWQMRLARNRKTREEHIAEHEKIRQLLLNQK